MINMNPPNGSNTNREQSESYKIHRKQAAWQIFIPIGLAAALIIFIAVMASLTTFRSPADGTRYSSISLIWILLPVLIAGFVLTVLLAGMIFGMGKLIQILPSFTWKVQYYFSLASKLVKLYSDKIISPVLIIRGWSAGSRVLKQRFRMPDIQSKG
jgi:hypothetical protein